MSCEATVEAGDRSVGGWLLLVLLAALVLFYLHVFSLIAAPHVSEAYRRTYFTGEFAVFPEAKGWAPRGGLDYRIGTFVDLRRPEMRVWVARFDWRRVETPAVTLFGFSGRLFLHVVDSPGAETRPHRLRLGFMCRLTVDHASDLFVAVNGRDIGRAPCSSGPVVFDAAVPAGLIGARAFDEISIRRASASVVEHLLTRLGFRADAVQLDWFSVDAQ